ncbi:MAG: hypothetical protein IJX51_00580 [Clostridia bacterium]|nr:hypothetical protein [Clostridia bacterium]
MKNRTKKVTAIVVFALVGIIAVLFILNMGVGADISDTKVKVTSFWYSEEILFSDIESVNIYTDFDYGERISSVGFIGAHRGTYRNEMLGEYKCAANKDVDSCIVIKLKSGEYYVFNSSDRAHTSTVYNHIKSKIA